MPKLTQASPIAILPMVKLELGDAASYLFLQYEI